MPIERSKSSATVKLEQHSTSALPLMVEATNLLVKIAQGDRTALSQLYDLYSRMMIYAIPLQRPHQRSKCPKQLYSRRRCLRSDRRI